MNDEVRARALRILDKRDVSRRMLIDKLTEKGASPEDAAEVADRFCTLGLINDARYAALVARHYAGRGYGEKRIRDELYRRGIDRELWQAALDELPPTDDGVYRALRARLKGDLSPEALRRASDALLRRGFSWGEVRAATERLRQEADCPDNDVYSQEFED